MDTHLPEYELYAIRYAERDARRSDHFIGGDPHDGPMPMDYFVWVAIAPHHTVVIDTGFTAEVAAARKRRFLRCPIEALSLVGVDGNIVRLEAYDTWRAHAPSPHHIIPGHDPLVMRQYPAPRPELEGVVVRLDIMPRG